MQIFNLPSVFTSVAKGFSIFLKDRVLYGTDTPSGACTDSASTLSRTRSKWHWTFQKASALDRGPIWWVFSGSSTISTSLHERCPSRQWELHRKRKILVVLIPGHYSSQCPLLAKLRVTPHVPVRIPAGSGTV